MDKVLSHEDIARVCYEANRAYAQGLGDLSNATWDLSPDWARASLLKGITGLQTCPDATPEELHEAWVANKVTEGWKWGPLKAPDLLEHPNIVPWAELPAEERLKDELFIFIVKLLLPLTIPLKQRDPPEEG